MKSTVEDLKGRRSVRKYKKEQITREELDIVLQAGICAPTAMNRQTPIIVAVQNSEDVAQLSRLNAAFLSGQSDPFYGAPTVAVVLYEAGARMGVQDASLVMGNLMNAAHAIGLGSCWINRGKEMFETEEGKALLKKWGVEGEYTGLACCILGYPDEEPAMKPRKENYIYYAD